VRWRFVKKKKKKKKKEETSVGFVLFERRQFKAWGSFLCKSKPESIATTSAGFVQCFSTHEAIARGILGFWAANEGRRT
jgi:hypothetical protein